MKIVCLVKQIPRADAIEFDEETKSLKREGVPLLLNPFDAYAVAHAARLRDEHGGEVIAMTMGPPQAEEVLRLAQALGADRSIHLSDRLFAVADTLGTSRTLAMAIQKEGADLVLCGRKTLDSETWQVPPEVAAFLGWNQATNVVSLEAAGEALRVRRIGDEGEDVYEVDLPAVCSVGVPPDGAVLEVEPVANGNIALWSAADLVPDAKPGDKRFGQPGSPRASSPCATSRPSARGSSSPTRAKRQPGCARCWRRGLRRRCPGTSRTASASSRARPTTCWSVVETIEGRPARVSLELVAKGRELAGKLGGKNVALLLGHGLDDAAEEVARRGGRRSSLRTIQRSPTTSRWSGRARWPRCSGASARMHC